MVEATRLATCIALTGIFYVATFKLIGVLQQSGYQNLAFFRWLKRSENGTYNRLVCWSGLSFLTSAFTSVCTSALGLKTALGVFFATFLLFSLVYCLFEREYVLKVPVAPTKRFIRVSVLYILAIAGGCYCLLSLFPTWGAVLVTVIPLILPFLLTFSNFLIIPYETRKNAKFVNDSREKLENANILRIGIVGSYGKTSVKNILYTILSEKYSVLATPQSYNTPLGIAKTVAENDLSAYEIFIAEMGARNDGDILELCELVKPDCAVFTGVCAQHLQTFKTEEKILLAKLEIVKGTKGTVVCGGGLKEKLRALDEAVLTREDFSKCEFVFSSDVEDVQLKTFGTAFTLRLPYGKRVEVDVPLLGGGAVENVALAVRLALELGLTEREIERGLKNVQPIPHRLQLIENNGVYILDDSYNCNERSAREAIASLKRFEGRKIAVTPGIVEGGSAEKKLNFSLGQELGRANLDGVYLVGGVLTKAIEEGFLSVGGNPAVLQTYSSLEEVKEKLASFLSSGDSVLFLNDLPDFY